MQDQLDRIEKELIEQEHRPIKLISNYIDRKEKWPDDESKQRSAKKAIVWRFFFSPAVIAFTGGSLAFLTLGALVWQNYIMKEQNEFLRRQLAAGDIAKYENIFLSETETSSRRQRAVVNYLRVMRTIPDESERIDLSGANLSGCSFNGPNQLFLNVDFNDVIVDDLTFSNLDMSNSKFAGMIKKQENSVWGFSACNLSNSNFTNVGFENFVLFGCDLNDSEGLPRGVGSYTSNNVILENRNLPYKEKFSDIIIDEQNRPITFEDFRVTRRKGIYLKRGIRKSSQLQEAWMVLLNEQNRDYAKTPMDSIDFKNLDEEDEYYDSILNYTPIQIYRRTIEKQIALIGKSKEYQIKRNANNGQIMGK